MGMTSSYKVFYLRTVLNGCGFGFLTDADPEVFHIGVIQVGELTLCGELWCTFIIACRVACLFFLLCCVSHVK